MIDEDAPGYDLTTEIQLLGTVMAAPDQCRGLFLSLPPEAWLDSRTRAVAAIITAMLKAGEFVNPATVRVQAQNAGARLGDKAGERDFVLECFTQSQPVSAAPLLADRVRNLAACREFDNLGVGLQQRGGSAWVTGIETADVETYLAFAKEKIDRIEQMMLGGRKSDRPKRFGEVLDEFWPWVDAPAEEKRTIATPWEPLNDALSGGLQPGRSYLFAGRPGGGKSLALTNIARCAADSGHPSVIFSAEMGAMEVAGRILADGADAEYGQITRRALDDWNRGKVSTYAQKAHGMPLWISDKSPVTIDQIRTFARQLKRQSDGLDVVFVDYVQLLSPTDSRQHRERQIADISWGLKMMAKELDVAVVSACQLNRSSVKDNRPPTIADLRESGALEQDSDVVVLLHHPMLDNKPTGEIQFILGKNRGGVQGVTISLDFKGYRAQIAAPRRDNASVR